MSRANEIIPLETLTRGRRENHPRRLVAAEFPPVPKTNTNRKDASLKRKPLWSFQFAAPRSGAVRQQFPDRAARLYRATGEVRLASQTACIYLGDSKSVSVTPQRPMIPNRRPRP